MRGKTHVILCLSLPALFNKMFLHLIFSFVCIFSKGA